MRGVVDTFVCASKRPGERSDRTFHRAWQRHMGKGRSCFDAHPHGVSSEAAEVRMIIILHERVSFGKR